MMRPNSNNHQVGMLSTLMHTNLLSTSAWHRGLIPTFALILLLATPASAKKKQLKQLFPDGTEIGAWFSDSSRVDVAQLGKQYVITDYGVRNDSTVLQTESIQKVIDTCADNGGGVVVVPEGTFLSGSLFFRPGTHLHLRRGATLKGIDAITHYKIVPTRLEGQTINYFAALINADHCDGFTISGEGTINGNGRRFWDEFWLRRKVNPKCTNLEALRPRLVYISNSNDVTVSDVHLINSGFWTNHLYQCQRVKFLGAYIYAPTAGYPKAPSSDGIDLDVCSDVLISGCYINVNDDGVCLKGGKGTFVDQTPGNGPCRNVIVENCNFGKANGGITFGSESYDDRNIILRNCHFNLTSHLLLFKMRPDTPQRYQYVLAENLTGTVRIGIQASKWTQFYDLKKRDDMPRSGVNNVVVRNIDVVCTGRFYAIDNSDKFDVANVTFENIHAKTPDTSMDTSFIEGCTVKNVNLEQVSKETVTDIHDMDKGLYSK